MSKVTSITTKWGSKMSQIEIECIHRIHGFLHVNIMSITISHRKCTESYSLYRASTEYGILFIFFRESNKRKIQNQLPMWFSTQMVASVVFLFSSFVMIVYYCYCYFLSRLNQTCSQFFNWWNAEFHHMHIHLTVFE